MALDVNVGMFLCAEDEGWGGEYQERFLADINATLHQLGLPEHREPRTLAEIHPPLDPGTDPCLLGARLGSYGSEKYQRLADFARHLAVLGAVPPADHPYDALAEQRYDDLPDRRAGFDHVIATATGMDTVVLPQQFDEVAYGTDRPVAHGLLVSAHRLRIESVMLGHAFRYADSRGHDWISDSVLDDDSFAHLNARIDDDPDVKQAWANEADLCHRLLSAATDVLRSGALGITG
ncbi:hypothetical protein [Spirillospora sp. NBC_01491]|uniref:hypothetical protein n=1 Tax=Spirillospora sp. NBC_01491 TaxID=2976007 RepID=UPI002E36EAF8|nr:hypothetical protein [Spirillospora sp. NBC_01491]